MRVVEMAHVEQNKNSPTTIELLVLSVVHAAPIEREDGTIQFLTARSFRYTYTLELHILHSLFDFYACL